jgi:hypothetical protein
LATIAADSVALAGATGVVEAEHAAKKAAARNASVNLTGTSSPVARKPAQNSAAAAAISRRRPPREDRAFAGGACAG